MPFATFRASAHSTATPDQVWSALQQAETWGGLGLISSVGDEQRSEAEELQSFSFRTEAAGRTWDGTARVVAASPGEHVDLALATNEMRGKVGVALAAADGGTDLAFRLEAEPAGMLATLFWGVVREAISNGFDQETAAFAARFDT